MRLDDASSVFLPLRNCQKAPALGALQRLAHHVLCRPRITVPLDLLPWADALSFSRRRTFLTPFNLKAST